MAKARRFIQCDVFTSEPTKGNALAHWLMQQGRVNRDLLVAQGTCINRTGRVAIRPDASQPGRVYIGGQSHVLIEGTVKF